MKLCVFIGLITWASQGMEPYALQLAQVWKKEAIEQILNTGANPEVLRDKNGKTLAHHAACKDRDGSLIIYLCTNYPKLIERKDTDGHTPLHFAAFHGNYRGVEALLSAGANPNAVNYRGKTPLHKAVQLGDTPTQFLQHIKAILNLLINAQANVNQQDHWGNTFLHDAAIRANETLYKELEKLPVNKKLQNKYKQTGLLLLSIAESQHRADHFLQQIQQKGSATSTSV